LVKKDKLEDEIKSDFEYKKLLSSEETLEYSSDTDKRLKKLWRSITQLEHNLREAMIMFYLEKNTLQDISEKLGITESYVKKLLFEGRHKIQENDKKHLYDIEREYRPKSMIMSLSGEGYISSPDFVHITHCLSKQNICLACYENACSMDELVNSLGLPCAYIEFDIKWLIERGYIIKQKNKYLTSFFIFDGSFNTRLIEIYTKHK